MSNDGIEALKGQNYRRVRACANCQRCWDMEVALECSAIAGKTVYVEPSMICDLYLDVEPPKRGGIG